MTYWENFYKKFKIKTPSSFAKFVGKFISKDILVYDLGCGNGRDSYYLSKRAGVIGIDTSVCPVDFKSASFIKGDAKDLQLHDTRCIFYMRFFIHSIDDTTLNKILRKKAKYLLIETRSDKDKPVIYKNHKRYLRSGKKLIDLLYKNNYELLYFFEGTGLSKFKNEDPVIIRIIAKYNE